jgi:large repetitive protein
MVKSNKLSRTLKSLRSKRPDNKQRKRANHFETLERRELMTNDFAPAVEGLLARMFVNGEEAYQRIGQQISSSSNGANGGGTSGGAGEASSSVNVVEVEPNNFQAQAQVLPVAANRLVNVSGSFRNFDDVDYYALDLNKGDILDTRLTGVAGLVPTMALYDPSGNELVFASGRFLGGNAFSDDSPLYTDGATTLPYVIGTAGRYYLRVADGTSAYTLNVRVHRSPFEPEAVGTQQIIYVDFDGALTRAETINLTALGVPPGTVRVPPLSRYMPFLGLTAADTPSVARNIMNRLDVKMRSSLASLSNNGFFPETGNPGDFSVRLVSSFDSPDLWGQENVSRIMVGGTQAEIGLDPATGLLGIAQSVDLGNFGHEESALVMVDIILADALSFPIAGNVTRADLFAELMSMVIAHEAGHFLGGVHQDPFNFVNTIMDQFYAADVSSGAGPDFIFGTADDVPLQFRNDEFAPTAGVPFGGGLHNNPDTLAFGMSTGRIGGSITGLVYNDANRNGRQDGSEAALSGWSVYIDLNNNGIRDSGEPRSITDTFGRYNLRSAAGTFNLRVVYPAGWVPSTSAEAVKSVTVTVNATANANFGAAFPTIGATGFKWLDLNGDGVRDANEPGLAGVYIYLDMDLDGRPDVGEPAALSGSDGSYTLTPPRPGTYHIREVVDPGYVQTFPASGFHVAVFDGSTPLAGYDFGNRESSDWGDAPAPYPTTRAQNGASHGFVPGLSLGANWDAELDGTNSAGADADDLNAATDDEDGITLLSPIVRGDSQNSIRISVNKPAGTTAYVQGWVDFNGNGSWNDPGEQIVTNLLVSAGDNIVNFTTPANAVSRTAARFRLSTAPGLGPTGRATAGEVEDYMFNIVDGPRRNLQDDVFTVNRNSTANLLDVLANDFVPPGDSISAVLLGTPSQGGVATLSAGNVVRYTPARGYFGQETFSYTVVFGSGRREEASVTVNVALQFIDPVAVDDSFDLPTDSVSFPLNVLLNDIEGQNGALTITDITTPNQGGSAVIGSGGLSIRYTPRRGFGGTEQFTYTATDGAGRSTTAEVTVHTLGGDRLDDDAQFSFDFRDMSGNPITRVTQGDQFQVYVYTYDLRPDRGLSQSPPVQIVDPGVYAAYLDVLYNSSLVLPGSPGTNTDLDFANSPQGLYQSGVSGTAQVPGVISSLGAFTGSSRPPFEFDDPSLFQILTFNARSAGIAEFVGDPANETPNTDVILYNPPNSPVPVERVQYLRSAIEVLPRGVETPFAVDDSPAPLALNSTSFIDVLRNDIVGTAGPIRITGVSQPLNGSVTIDTRGTDSPTDDRIQFVPVSSSIGFTDQFTYTITDTRGFTSTATVTVQVGDASENDNVRLTLRTTDINGNVITSIPIGGEFELRGFVEDLRSPFNQSGVFAAYQDILYDRSLVAVGTSGGGLGFDITFASGSSGYEQGQSGDTLIPGLINEVGSFQNSLNPLGTEELLQFRIRMRANAAGIARFAGDPADISPFHDTLLYSDQRNKVPFDRITYVPAQIVIGGGGSSGGGGGEGNTNLTNRFDVNNDGFVSPIDVLILVNLMNQGQGGSLDNGGNGGNAEGENGETYFVDVDSDGFLTPLDALLVVNELNGRRGNGEGEGEGLAAPIVSSQTQVTSVPAPVLQASLARSLASAIGPQVAAATRPSDNISLDSYLAGLVDDDEDDDELDEVTSDLLRVRFDA